MQLLEPKRKTSFDFKVLESFLAQENKFITNLFSIVAFPERYGEGQEDETNEVETSKVPPLVTNKKTRATDITDLQRRLDGIRNKKKLTYKEKQQKKGLKNRLKIKNKKQEMKAKQKQLKAGKTSETKEKSEEKPKETIQQESKPVFNAENKMVFSKIDFSGLGEKKVIKNKKKLRKEKDPKTILENIEKQKKVLKELEQKGEVEKVVKIKEKTAWKNALAKSHGEKVKDDPLLLKKTIQKQEQRKRQNSKKWEKRVEGVKKAKEERQKKRSDNIDKRKQDKKKNKIKRAVKKGRIVPGH